MGFYGDLLVPDIDPFVAAVRYSSSEIRAELEKLSVIAHELDLTEIWAYALFAAPESMIRPSRFNRLNLPPPMGTDFTHAPNMGVGLWLEWSWDSFGRRKEEAELTQKRVEALSKVMSQAAGRVAFPLSLELAIPEIWLYDFHIGYRRGLAYALGFEASLKAKSLKPYQDHWRVLTIGSVDELRRATPTVDAPDAFSIYLNLIAFLDQAVAWQTDQGSPPPYAAGELSDSGKKRDFLHDQFYQAARIRLKPLVFEGQLALHVILEEVEKNRYGGGHNRAPFMRWGWWTNSAGYERTTLPNI